MYRILTLSSALLLSGAFAACVVSKKDETTPEPEPCRTNADCSADAPLCDASGRCAAPPAGHLIGWGNGADIVTIYTPDAALLPIQATDLGFHPTRTNELWVLHRKPESQQPCNQNNATLEGCIALEGSIVVVFNPGTPEQGTWEYRDPNAWHFMRRPPAFAFGQGATFASVGEARTGNYLDDPVPYMGPTLWSSDLPGVVEGCESSPGGCFSIQPPGLNGSHLDMLHEAPYGMGIAHETGNAYWVFNGDAGSLDRFDFQADHGPGEEYHGDGMLKRYVEGQLERVPEVPSHLVFYEGHVYVSDTGGARVAKLDPATGTPNGENTAFEPLALNQRIEGATLTNVVPPGVLAAPSGLEIHQDTLYVSDNGTGVIHAFDLASGEEVMSLDTGLPPGSLAGMAVGPDGKLYFVDKPAGAVLRIDPR